MWFFRKKLTQEQRISLGKLAEDLNSLTQAKEAAFAAALRDVADLLANCMAGQDSGAGRPLVPPAASEIIAARETLLAYEDTAWPSISELERVDIPEWVPSKFAEHRRQVLSFWESHFKFVGVTIAGLAPPDLLVDQPEVAKLNQFTSGMSLAARMVKHHELRP